MRRGFYIRLVAHRFQAGVSTPDLSTRFLISDFRWIVEGWLSAHVAIGGRIHMTVRIENGKPVLGYLTTGLIGHIANPYVLTDELICQLLRVPPSRRESFAEWA